MTVAPINEVRVLVVDDSAFMRKAISMMLESDPAIKVVGTARDGQEGVEKARLLKPDLITMDIEMPRMDGLTALREIMNKDPRPVMMVSSITTDGAQATLDALELGAVDFIPKQMSYVSLDIVKIKDELIAKIKDIVRRKNLLMARFRTSAFHAARSKTGQISDRVSRPVSISSPAARRRHSTAIGIVVIGSSTGGPLALQSVIPRLPRNFPVGIVIAQHMPPTFTKSLAERLDGLSQVQVAEAVGGEKIEPGQVLIAPGGRHLTIRKQGTSSYAAVVDYPADSLYKPCVDVTVSSVARAFGPASMVVILTGMGSNGVEGAKLVRNAGGVIIAQNEASCVVYGMPRAIVEANIADLVTPIDNIATEIVSYF